MPIPMLALICLAGVCRTQPLSAPAKVYPCGCEPEEQYALTTPWRHSPDVRGLQAYLAKLGYDPGAIDGVYGPRTAEAVRKFQARQRLKADGIMHPDTWAALGQTVAGRKLSGISKGHHYELVVDIALAILAVYERGRVVVVYPVALGKIGTPTPVGNFTINAKASWSGGFGTRWLGLDVPWGVYGIHGTNKPWTIGGYASHGCIRMFNSDVEQLSEMVGVGTPVHIIGDPFYGTDKLVRDETGAPVRFLQKRLKQLGFYRGRDDGEFGAATEQAVIAFQKASGLESTGQIGGEEIRKLRLRCTD